jgi:adenylosuccinate lyase
VLRNMGVALGYATLAYQRWAPASASWSSTKKRCAEDLDASWEVLAEPIQTVMRRYGVQGAYEKLKEVTRGKTGGRGDLHG